MNIQRKFDEMCNSLDSIQKAFLHLKRREETLADAMAEISAVIRGKSDQSIEKIVNECIEELKLI